MEMSNTNSKSPFSCDEEDFQLIFNFEDNEMKYLDSNFYLTGAIETEDIHQNEELRILEDQIYQMSIDEMFAKSKGLPYFIFNKIPKMKMNNSTKNCSICITTFSKGDIIRKLPCKHIFHNDCIKPWFRRNIHCPICRFDLFQYYSEIKL